MTTQVLQKNVINDYLMTRLKALNLSLQDTEYTRKMPITQEEYTSYFFQGDENDNIVINYFSLQGGDLMFKRNGNKWGEQVKRTRLKFPIVENGKELKYLSPKGSGTPAFFPLQLIHAYQNKQEIQTVFITEGEFKAFKSTHEGMPTIGIPSINGFWGGENGKINEDIDNFLRVCKVKNVVYLTDADTLTVRWEKDKDLFMRPNTFYSCIKNFRNSLEYLIDDKNVALSNVYFMHIKTSFCEDDSKGLDDLFCNHAAMKESIIKDAYNFNFANEFFHGISITDARLRGLWSYFGLSNETEFFEKYGKIIGNREFVFRRRRYQYDGEKVVYVQHEESDKYMRIGADWFKKVSFLNKHDKIEKQLKTWKISEIQRDYKAYPTFIQDIPRYDGFCSVPDWSESYKRVHHNLFNMFEPLEWELKEGDFPNTKMFLKHLFRGNANFEQDITGDLFTVALDYLTIMFQYPKQQLPVPCLVSTEFGTGKSTFLKWLQAIYGENTSILSNEQFKMSFNAHYITKFIISIDEGFLDIDKKAEKERLKQLATADTQYLQQKGVDLQKFNYYGKLILCSNDADSIMKIEGGEDRWWVIRVFPFNEEAKDPQLENKMFKEIPYFLHFLKNRKIHHENKSRLWFEPKHIQTEQMAKIVQNTKTKVEQIFEDFIVDYLIKFELQEVFLDIPTIVEQLSKQMKYKTDTITIKRIFKKKGLEPLDSQWIKFPIDNINMPQHSEIITKKARPYLLKLSDWDNQE